MSNSKKTQTHISEHHCTECHQPIHEVIDIRHELREFDDAFGHQDIIERLERMFGNNLLGLRDSEIDSIQLADDYLLIQKLKKLHFKLSLAINSMPD